MAKTGETRKTKQPLKIDRLPTEVIDAILFLRNTRGKPWLEIEAQSAEKYSKSWKLKGGFVNWAKMPADVLALFPLKKLPHSNLQRWWDLRVSQVQANVERMALQAREISAVFANAVKSDDKDSVIAATKDILLGILAEDGSVGGRAAVAEGLTELASVMERGVTNKLRERVVAIAERKVQALEKREKAAQAKLEAESQQLKKKATKGAITAEDVDRLYERVFGQRPKPKADS